MSDEGNSTKAVVGWLGALIIATAGLFINNTLNDPSCGMAGELVRDDKYNSLLNEEQGKEITNWAAKKVTECLKEDLE